MFEFGIILIFSVQYFYDLSEINIAGTSPVFGKKV